MSTNSSNDSCILAIIGDGSVGKSSLIAAFRNDNFQKIYKQTIGCDFYEKIVTLSGRTISLRVWDIGGQSMNSKNLPEYLSSSDLVFIVYDVTNSESFANVEDWLALAMKYSPQADMHIVGNKVVCECVSVLCCVVICYVMSCYAYVMLMRVLCYAYVVLWCLFHSLCCGV